MRVLLTGATGFLGTRLLSMLGDHEVLCPSRNPSRLPQRDGVIGIAADLTRDGNWTERVAAFKPEWCFHLAWEALPDYSLDRCRINLDAGLRVLDVSARAGVEKMVVGGSCWEYGSLSGPVSEDMVPGEVSVFAATKHALMSVLHSVTRDAAFQYRWARIFFVYGVGQRPTSPIPYLGRTYAEGLQPVVRQPSAVQDYVHVDDVAAALVALAACDARSGIFNVGSGRPTSVGHVANRTAEYFGAAHPFQSVPEGEGYWADMTKTIACTGWRPQIGIDEGIDRTLAALGKVA